MIFREGVYEGINWCEYDSGNEPFVAFPKEGEPFRAKTQKELEQKIREFLQDAGSTIKRDVIKILSGESSNEISDKTREKSKIPKYSDILKAYGCEAEIRPHKPKLMSPKERDEILELTQKSIEDYSLATEESEFNRGDLLVETKKNIGENFIFRMRAGVAKPPDPSIYREEVLFELTKDQGNFATFVLTRNCQNNEVMWNLFHRQIYEKEYQGGSQEKNGVSRIMMDAVCLFLQNRANKLGKPITLTIKFSQPQVGVWGLKEGFTPKDNNQRRRWQRMTEGTGLEMKGEGHVYPLETPLGIGYDKFDYEEYGYRIEFIKTFIPEDDIEK